MEIFLNHFKMFSAKHIHILRTYIHLRVGGTRELLARSSLKLYLKREREARTGDDPPASKTAFLPGFCSPQPFPRPMPSELVPGSAAAGPPPQSQQTFTTEAQNTLVRIRE